MASILRVNTLTDASSNNSVATNVLLHKEVQKLGQYGFGQTCITNRFKQSLLQTTDEDFTQWSM